MINSIRIILHNKNQPLTFANIKPKFAKTILKWDTVLIGKNVSLLMGLKIYVGDNLLTPRNFIGQDNANHSGIRPIVTMDLDVNFLIMSAQDQID